jgi:hypothetical protein
MAKQAKEIKPATNILAKPLQDIAATGEKVEAAATGLLTAIRKGDIRTLGAFDDHVTAAYEANKWNTRPGRPAKDRRNVPHTVRTYVWELRSAYRAGVEVWTLKTMYEVRMAKRANAEAAKAEAEGQGADVVTADLPAEVVQDLEGVRVLDAKRPNGALFHDLIATFIQLPADSRALFGRQLARILHRYQADIVSTHTRGVDEPKGGRKAAANA